MRLRNQDKLYTYPEFQKVAKRRGKEIYQRVTKPRNELKKKERERLGVRGGNLLF